MNNILSFLFILLSLQTFAKETEEWVPQIMLISSEKDESLSKNESQFIFEFFNISSDENQKIKIHYSIDNIENKSFLDSNNKLYIKSKPGVHNFQFYYNDQYFEVYADSLNALPQHSDYYEIRFESSEFPTVVEKPVIYLYPESEINFSVQVNPKGKLSFTYPKYNEEWKGKVDPNGNIKIESNEYNYLFWESNQSINLNQIDLNKGAIVKGKEALSFLENQLNKFGFTTKEKADFITFWAPQLQKNEFNYIYFVLNNDADIFAELSVTPKPNNIYRFYMLTSKIENPNDFYYLEPQLIESVNRTGFTVLEWGGSKIDINIEKLNHQSL